MTDEDQENQDDTFTNCRICKTCQISKPKELCSYCSTRPTVPDSVHKRIDKIRQAYNQTVELMFERAEAQGPAYLQGEYDADCVRCGELSWELVVIDRKYQTWSHNTLNLWSKEMRDRFDKLTGQYDPR